MGFYGDGNAHSSTMSGTNWKAAVDEAAVGEAQVWQAGEGDEGHGHEWRWHAAADGFPGFFEGGDVCCHFFGGFVVH